MPKLPTTLEVLDLLIDRAREFPLLCVLTHRPEFQSRWGQHGHVTALNLAKLTRSQSTALVSKVAHDKALPGDLLAQIVAKTDGVPLFVEELTKAVLESDQIRELEDRFEYVGNASALSIPATLRDSLMARLDRHPLAKEIAQIGAVIGREFSDELIAAVAPKSRRDLEQALAQLTESGLAFRRGVAPQVTYTFKHALVQDAAYDSLLKSRRQELHGSIAAAIERIHPEVKDTEPELLAHHATKAGLVVQAVPLWHQSGELALKRMALAEAIAHLEAGLRLLPPIAASRQRDEWELDLRTSLGTAWMARKGWASDEAQAAFSPTLALARALGRNDALIPILWGFSSFDLNGGRVANAIARADQFLSLAEEVGSTDLMAVGCICAVCANQCGGNFQAANQHADRLLRARGNVDPDRIARLTNHDPFTVFGVFTSHATWMLGYPDQAIRISQEIAERGRQFGHAFSVGHALIVGGQLFDYVRDVAAYRVCADEALRVAQENDLPLFANVMVPCMHAVADIREGAHARGLAALRQLLPRREERGQHLRIPYFKSVMAQACAHLGDLEQARKYVDEAIAQIERPGWEERAHHAEILRIRGWIHSQAGDVLAAQHDYLASLEVARQQQAKSWELRTAMSLARLWQSQNRAREAYELLALIHCWFTEGFDTQDLRNAQ